VCPHNYSLTFRGLPMLLPLMRKRTLQLEPDEL
jgi:hypothetical protein